MVELGEGGRLEDSAEWRGVAKLLDAFRRHYELELRPGMVFADVGACYGVYTVLVA